MKKTLILIPFLLWVTLVTAGEPKKQKFLTFEPERTTVDSTGKPIGAIVWSISTIHLVGNQVVGQFHRFDKRPFQKFLFTDKQVQDFLDKHGKEFICYNSENYFLVKRQQQVILLCITRTDYEFPRTEVAEIDKKLIADSDFGIIKLFLPNVSKKKRT